MSKTKNPPEHVALHWPEVEAEEIREAFSARALEEAFGSEIKVMTLIMGLQRYLPSFVAPEVKK